MKRENSLDLLRIIAAFSVVLMHINACFFDFTMDRGDSINIIENCINLITRFSVPCFVMLSGAFILGNPNNKNYKQFYSKIFYKTGIPFLIVASFYLVFTVFWTLLRGENNSLNVILHPIKDFLFGGGYNLWFMYMLFGLYILTPVILRFKESISEKSFLLVSFIWLFFGICNQFTSSFSLSYAFGNVCSFLGYYLVGNVIYEQCRKRISSILLAIITMLCFMITFMFRYWTGNENYSWHPFLSFFSPFIVVASCCIFAMFCNFSIRRDYSYLSGRTLYIYMFHTFNFKVFFYLFGQKFEGNEIMVIVVITVIIFLFSWFIAELYIRLWNFIESKFHLKEKYNKFLLSI